MRGGGQRHSFIESLNNWAGSVFSAVLCGPGVPGRNPRPNG